MILYYQLNKPPNLPTYLCKSLLLHYQPTYLPTYQPTNLPTNQPTNHLPLFASAKLLATCLHNSLCLCIPLILHYKPINLYHCSM